MSKANLNLMTWESRRKCLIRRQVARWGRVVLLMAMLSGVCWWSVRDDFEEARSRLAQLNERAELYRSQVAVNAKTRKQNLQAERRRDLFNQLASPHEPLQLVGIVSAGSREQNGQIRVMSFSIGLDQSAPQDVRPVTPKQGAKPEQQAKDQPPVSLRHALILSGVADDDQALSRFITALRESDVFVDVELKSSREITLAEKPVREYEVHCVF